MATRRWPGWLVLVLIGIVVAVAAGPASAQEPVRFSFGTVDLGLSAAYSLSHDREGVEQVTGFHVLPHVGIFLSDEVGPAWVRGNFELLAEPALLHLKSEVPTVSSSVNRKTSPSTSVSDTIFGLSALVRWVFAVSPTVRPYLEFGGGIFGGQLDFRQTNCDVNYSFQGGPGILFFVSELTAISVAYRFQHLSNGDRCDQNLGINSSVIMLGVSYILP